MTTDFTLSETSIAEATPAILDLHDRGYRDFDPRFSDAHMPEMLAYVHQTLEEAETLDGARNRAWLGQVAGRAEGCIALIDRGERCQLRWFVVAPGARGLGMGRTLMTACMDYASAGPWTCIYLETVEGLAASMGLYEAWGFKTTRNAGADLWHGHGHEVIMARAV